MKKYTNFKISLTAILIISLSALVHGQQNCMKIGMNNWFYAYWSPDFPFANDFHKSTFGTSDVSNLGSYDSGLKQYVPMDSSGYPLQIPFDPLQDNPDRGPQNFYKIILGQGTNQRHLPNGPSPASEYVVLYDGDGTLYFDEAVSAKGAPTIYTDAQGKVTGGRYALQWNNASGSGWGKLFITRSVLGNHIRNIRILMPGTESTYKTDFADPVYKSAMSPFYLNRFMDWGHTNFSTMVKWSDRKKMHQEDWSQGTGMPYEAMIKFSNSIKKHAWVCVPHLANDDFIENMAKLWHDSLDSDLKVFVEFSNEIWNDGFGQAQYLKGLGPNYGNAEIAAKMINTWKIWRRVWGRDSLRVNRLIATQAAQKAWLDRWVSEMKPGDFDYIATSWYHGIAANTPTQSYNLSVNDWRSTQSVWHREFAKIAKQFNAKLCCYEGGGSVIEGNNPNGRTFEQSPQYQLMEQEVIDTLNKIGYDFINHYTFIGARGDNGSFGILDHSYEPVANNNKYTIIKNNSLPCYVVTVTSDTLSSGLAIAFDGANDRIEFNSIAKPSGFSDDFTYEFWTKPDFIAENQIIFSATNTTSGFSMNLRINFQNLLHFEIPGTVSLFTTTPLNSNEWQHIVVSKFGSDYRLYVNGVERAYTNVPSSGSFGFNTFTIGAKTSNGITFNENYSGQIDEFKYWNTAISSVSTIRDWMCKKTTGLHPNYANLSAYARFDVVSTNVVANRVGAATGRLVNFTNPEKPAQAPSGAPIGDESVFIYNASSLSFVHPQGDRFNVIGNLAPQLSDGIHLYISNRTPSGINIPAGFTSYSGLRYFGAFFTNSATTYDFKYTYAGNPTATAPNSGMRLLRREDNSIKKWQNGVSSEEVNTSSLKIECREKYRAEYLLAFRNAVGGPRKTRVGNAVSLPNGRSINVPVYLDNNFTITTWFKGTGRIFNITNESSGAGQFNAISNYFGIGGSLAHTANEIGGGWGKVPDVSSTNWNSNEGCPSGDCPDIYPNDWNHLAVVINKSNKTINSYLNGVLHTTGTLNRFAFEAVFNNVQIGGGSTTGSPDGPFVGEIDEFAVFNTTLNPTEIRDYMCKVMDKNHPKYCGNLVAYFNFDEDGSKSSFENPFGTGDGLVNAGTVSMVRSGAKAGDVSN